MSVCLLPLSLFFLFLLFFLLVCFLISLSCLSTACLSFVSCLSAFPSPVSLHNPNPLCFSIPSSLHRALWPCALTSQVESWVGGMAEGGVGTCPQVFVVDSQANFVSLPSTKKPRWIRGGQKFLLLLVGLALLGLVIEGFFIYKLYMQNEVRLIIACNCVSVCLCESVKERSLSAWCA